MRGALASTTGPILSGRIIPADAGSTVPAAEPEAWAGDHPRGCGEHPRACLVRETTRGSSPRMRGAPLRGRGCGRGSRIIPADAGSTEHGTSASDPTKDHPRGCGEHLLDSRIPASAAGSSPRMRGARQAVVQGQHPPGIIPADAGSTRPCRPWDPVHPDHPRGCGEHDQTMPGKRS